MFKTQITLLLLTVLSFSCSSKLSEYFTDKEKTNERNEKLIESFDDEEDVLKKFQEKKEKNIPVEKKSMNTKALVKKKIKKKSSKQITLKKSPPKNKRTTKKEKVKKELEYSEVFKQIDKETENEWKEFKPIIVEGEETYLDINYMGVSTGKIALTTLAQTKLGEKDVYHFHARVKTSTYYSYLYELDDNIDSYIDMKTFTPVKFSLIQRESGQDVDDLQLFDSEKLKTYTFYKRVTKKKTKKKKQTKPTPIRFQDPLSVFHFLRGLPLVKNKVYTVPMMNKGKVLVLKAKAVGREVLDTEIGDIEAIKVEASTQYTGDTLKSGDMTFWFSSDERRVFLKFEAKIKIGSISGDIEKYER